MLYKKTVLAVVAVTLLVSMAQAATATKAPTKTPPPTKQTGASKDASKTCEVNGLKIKNMSIRMWTDTDYVACRNGKAGCFRKHQHQNGDVIPCPKDLVDKVKHHKQHIKKRELSVVVANNTRRWDRGVVCYNLDADLPFNDKQRELIQKSMKIYESQTNVRFLPVDTCKTQGMDYCNKCQIYGNLMHPPTGRDCNSSIGINTKSIQKVYLADRCFQAGNDAQKTDFGSVVHEFGHLLGLLHEHQHPSRFLAIFYGEVDQSIWGELSRRTEDVQGGLYNPQSIMHYPPSYGMCYPKICEDGQTPGNDCVAKGTIFCDVDDDKRKTNCVVPVKSMCDDTKTAEIGQRNHLSDGDLGALNQMYPTPAWDEADSKIQ